VFAPNNSGRTGQPKHTLLNVKEIPEVVINVVTESMVEQMNVAAAPWDKGVSEFEKAGFTPVQSDLVKPFRVAESPSQIECKVIEIKEMGVGGGAGNLVICQVVRIHIKDEVLNDENKIDQRKMKLVGRLGASWYSKTDDAALFELAQPMSPTLGYDGLPDYVRLSDNLNGNEIGKLASLDSMPDEITINDVSKERNMGDEWSQIKSYLNSGDYNKALALLQLLHQ
jgi:flavin reductase (DIM6/NTAB) family NADH-FMN oxidoreductase RutF